MKSSLKKWLFIVIILSLGGSIVYGLGILSVSKVDFLTYDRILKDQAWLIEATLNGQAQEIIGTFSSDELNRRRVPGVGEQVKNDFTLSMSLDEFTCEYPIVAQDEYIWNYEYERAEFPMEIGGKEFLVDCITKHEDWNLRGKGKCRWIAPPLYACEYYCVWRNKIARYGRILDPKTHFKATIKITSDGKTTKTTIDSHNTKTAPLGDAGYLRWVGYLGTDEDCPTAPARGISAMYSLFSFSGGIPQLTWSLTDEDKWIAYKAFSMDGCFRDVLVGTKKINECITENNNLAKKAMYPKSWSFYLSDIEKSAYATVDRGVVTMDIPKLLKFPSFILRVKADWLGVITPSGRPKLVEVKANPIRTGSEGAISIKIKNIGEGPGAFDTSVVCDPPFRVTESPSTITVPVDETLTTYARVYASCDEETHGTCTITTKDSENEIKRDTTKISLICKPIVMCYTEGEVRCNGNLIEQCEKGKWKPITTCEYGCERIDHKVKCKTPPSVCGNGVCEQGETRINCPQDCQRTICGNGVCEQGETRINCPQDCQRIICGNGVCEQGETYTTCPQDCKHPCDITCPTFDINCYNRIISCWVGEITKSIKMALIVLGVITLLAIVAYAILKKPKYPPRERTMEERYGWWRGS